MTPQERVLIDELFDRIRRTETGPRDQDAASLIARRMTEDPGAAYALVQTALVQAEALRQAETRINELERAAPAPGGGSFLPGAGSPWTRPLQPMPAAPPPQPAPQPGPMAGPWSATAPGAAPGQAGGFLRSALTTAAGVAGGALLFEGIRNLMGGHGAMGGWGGLGGGNPTINETVIVEQPRERDRDGSRDDVADNDSGDSDSWDTSDDDMTA